MNQQIFKEIQTSELLTWHKSKCLNFQNGFYANLNISRNPYPQK